ncbi:MAG: transcription termination/antitermination factor NusG [Planctomycetia bacterium]|nr:transcription termination/antitermination factor NusG [Planctomycetia bacterium]
MDEDSLELPEEVVAAEEAESAPAAAPEPAEPSEPARPPREPDYSKMQWYILKVASNREDSIRSGLLRRAKIAGLEHCFGEVIVPTESITEYKNGKRRTKKQKIWPGYLIVQMELDDDTWFLVRETPGIGDFTGSADRSTGARPSPMLPQEVEKILAKCRPRRAPEEGEEKPKPKILFKEHDKVKINDGNFQNFEGEVGRVDQTSGRVTVLINIFGRTTPVELEGWQIEAV